MSRRILVVDDYDAGRYAVGRVLRVAGFETSEAGTGLEALRRICGVMGLQNLFMEPASSGAGQ